MGNRHGMYAQVIVKDGYISYSRREATVMRHAKYDLPVPQPQSRTQAQDAELSRLGRGILGARRKELSGGYLGSNVVRVQSASQLFIPRSTYRPLVMTAPIA